MSAVPTEQGVGMSEENKALVRANGKLAEHWSAVDALSLLMQMGAIPAPG